MCNVYIHNITIIYASEYNVYMLLSSPNWPMTRSFLENPELVHLFDACFNRIYAKKSVLSNKNNNNSNNTL